jgi:DNA-binding Lrp family transcriptional regulator
MAKAYILIHTAAGAGGEVRDRIRTIPGVLAAHVLTGAYDVIVEAWGKSQHDIRVEVIEPIEALDGVLRAIPCPVGAHDHLWDEILDPAYALV